MLLRKFVLALMILGLVWGPAIPAAAYNAGVVWNVSTAGADTNGGAFDPTVAAPGTDESAGAGTAETCTLTATNQGTCVPAISSTTHGPGNFFNVASGTGCTVGIYEIESQTTGTATFDRVMGTSTDVCVGVLGGKLATWGAVLTAWNANGGAGQNSFVNVQSGTYTITTGLTHSGGEGLNWQGYQTTAGDLTPTTYSTHRPLLTTATNSINNYTNSSGVNDVFEYIKVSTTAGTPGELVKSGSNSSGFNLHYTQLNGGTIPLDVSNFAGITDNLWASEVENSTGAGIGGTGSSLTFINLLNGTWIHNNGGGGVVTTGAYTTSFTCRNSLVTDNTGNGVSLPSSTYGVTSDHCTYANNTSVPFIFNTGNPFINQAGATFTNNVFWGPGTGNCLSLPTAATVTGQATPEAMSTNNAYGNCSGGATLNFADSNRITLTANPFNSSTDYGPNATSGGGALLRNAAFPGAFAGLSSTSYEDVGAVRHQDPAGGGNAVFYGRSQ